MASRIATTVRLARTGAQLVVNPVATAAKVAVRTGRRHPWIVGVVLLPSLLSVLFAGTAVFLLVEANENVRNAAASVAGVGGSAGTMWSRGGGEGVSPTACPGDIEAMQRLTQIPVPALAAYCMAAEQRDVEWAVLAAIGDQECAHGTSRLAGCNPDIPSDSNPAVPATNFAGARGPMQFLGSTWRAEVATMDPNAAGPPVADGQEGRGYASDGDGDGIADPWSFPDAAVGAARLLLRNGVTTDLRRALWAYNPAQFYVDEVSMKVTRYRVAVAPLVTPVPAPGGGGGVGAPVPIAQTTEVYGIRVNLLIADQVRRLMEDARAAGVPLGGWGWRDQQDQIDLRRRNCGPTQYDIWERPSGQCRPPTARPGRSMHERGLAIDFTCAGNGIPERSGPCWSWLRANAERYGLYNLPSEPWHWSTNGN